MGDVSSQEGNQCKGFPTTNGQSLVGLDFLGVDMYIYVYIHINDYVRLYAPKEGQRPAS